MIDSTYGNSGMARLYQESGEGTTSVTILGAEPLRTLRAPGIEGSPITPGRTVSLPAHVAAELVARGRALAA